MEMSDERFQEILASLDLARDIRKARPADADKIAIALSHKLSHDDFECDPKACAENLLEIVEAKIEERLSEILGIDRSEGNFTDKVESVQGFKFFLSVSIAAKNRLKELIEYIDDEEPDESAVEFASTVLGAIDKVNSVLVNGDVLPLIQRGVYASDIALALETWTSKRVEQGDSESFWHEELKSRKGVLERLLGGHAILLQDEFHVGTTDSKGKGSKRADFAFLNRANNVSLVEIKSPNTNLLGASYRDTFPLSKEVSGGVAQVLIQRSELMMNFYQKRALSEVPFEVFAPRCYLVVGDLSSIANSKERLRAFEVQRQAVASHVTIMTFDELYEQFSTFNQL